MAQVYRIDSNGFYIEPVMLKDGDKCPSDCRTDAPPAGLNKIKRNAANNGWMEGLSSDQILSSLKTAKIAQLTDSETQTNGTFQSSALGSAHTYLSTNDAMAKFNAEYAFVNSAAYDGSPILWFTLEAGGVIHTKDQFNQVWLGGRNIIAANFAKWDSLVKQVQAAKIAGEVNAIVW